MINKWSYEGNQCKYTKPLSSKTTPLILTKDNPAVYHDAPSWIKFYIRALTSQPNENISQPYIFYTNCLDYVF